MKHRKKSDFISGMNMVRPDTYAWSNPSKDLLSGGVSEGKNFKIDPEELKMGIKIELEHTKNHQLAKEIAQDHLYEDPKYYTKLKKVEAGLRKKALGLTSIPSSNVDKRLDGDSDFEVGSQRGSPAQSFVDGFDGVGNQLFGGRDDVNLEDSGSQYNLSDDDDVKRLLNSLESFLRDRDLKKSKQISILKKKLQ